MSESKNIGQCRKQFEESYADNLNCAPRYAWITADAIDRLAADVESVMEMTQEIALRVPSEFGQDACDVAVRVLEKDRDAAVRERDEARAEVERLRAEVEDDDRLIDQLIVGNAALASQLDEARAEAQRIQDEADDKEQTEKVKRLNAEIEKTHRTLLNRTWERDTANEQVERLRAELAARPAANSPGILDSSPAAPQSAAPPAGWLTEDERELLQSRSRALRRWLVGRLPPPIEVTREADAIDALLARAGSPPAVEVPAMVFGSGSWEMHKRYRAALDKAGISWKEVPRE